MRPWLMLVYATALGGMLYAVTYRLGMLQWAVLGRNGLILAAPVLLASSIWVVVRRRGARLANGLFALAILAGLGGFFSYWAIVYKEEVTDGDLFKKARYGRTSDVTELLDARRYGPDIVDPDGSSLLMLAAQYGHTDTVAELLRRGALTDYRDLDGDTALMMAERNGHKEIVALLRKVGARR